MACVDPATPSRPEASFPKAALPDALSALREQLGPVDLARARHLALDPGIALSAVRRLGPAATKPLPPSPYRLLVVFMAAQPDGLSGLAVDQEEVAIRCAARGIGMDLVVEDSGNLQLLGARVAQVGECDIIALSCHGKVDPPVLALAGDLGKRVDATADDLSIAIGTKPRLLFLSACSTAAAATAADGPTRSSPMGRDIVVATPWPDVSRRCMGPTCSGHSQSTCAGAGWPAVVGWSSVVTDQGAIEFSAALYRQLVQRVPLVEVLARARMAFARTPRGAEWHKARLFLGPVGGGKVVDGTRAHPGQPDTVRDQEFLDTATWTIPVAGPNQPFPHRRVLQRVMVALRDGDWNARVTMSNRDSTGGSTGC